MTPAQFLKSRWFIFAHDLAWVPLTLFLAFVLRFNLQIPEPQYILGFFVTCLVALPVHAATFWMFGCYRGVWRFASLPDLLRITKAVALGALITALGVFLWTRLANVPRSVLLLYPLLLVAGVIGPRLIQRILKDSRVFQTDERVERILIAGAGRAGALLARDLLSQQSMLLTCFVDDDPHKQGLDVHGVRVRGTMRDIPSLVRKYDVDVVLIALPSASRETMDLVVRLCAKAGVKCRTLPSLVELADGRVEVSRLRPVTVEDLLGREPVVLDQSAITAALRGKGVLITGGGGSIGSELSAQVASHGPRELVIYDNSEFNLYQIEHGLRRQFPDLRMRAILGDIRDPVAVEKLFRTWRPDVVFHAAAYKHVPIVEENPVAGVSNNVLGTRIVADAAAQNGVRHFVLISTDKTVNPRNIMGASKRVAELYCQTLSRHSDTHFITTRFGNVLGSTGSVVPLFEKQIAHGGPVTVTHPEVSRYFMTIPEAAGLILQAEAMGKGGEIFVLDMGEPVLIRDLAEKMIRLCGLQPGRDVQIVYTGLRPGEKLNEELFYEQEELGATSHPKIMLANCARVEHEWLQEELTLLERAVLSANDPEIIASLRRIVPHFEPGEPAEVTLPAREVPLRVIK